jgi:DNA-binding response OmpR family regulator
MARPTVLLLNGNEDLLEVLCELVEREGLRAVYALIPDLERGRVDFTALMREHTPAAIVFDVSLPYSWSWSTFKELSARPVVTGIPFVLTTTNKDAAEEFTGPDVIELLFKPYDIVRFLEAVKVAVDRSSRHRGEGVIRAETQRSA